MLILNCQCCSAACRLGQGNIAIAYSYGANNLLYFYDQRYSSFTTACSQFLSCYAVSSRFRFRLSLGCLLCNFVSHDVGRVSGSGWRAPVQETSVADSLI